MIITFFVQYKSDDVVSLENDFLEFLLNVVYRTSGTMWSMEHMNNMKNANHSQKFNDMYYKLCVAIKRRDVKKKGELYYQKIKTGRNLYVISFAYYFCSLL